MKRSLLLLTLVLICFYPSGEAQNNLSTVNDLKTKQAGTKTSQKIFVKHADQCLALIEQAAKKISIKGVAIVAYLPGDVTETWISKMKVVGNLTSGKANLLGIAYTKASEMADTHRDSGSKIREIYSGELGYKGGLIKKVNSGYILAVFSGGSGEQDLEVAKIGLDWLSKYY
ncbi:MAG: hypothetical protein Q8S54_06790 [Bacteroidota bacterium]|nr:hypothetical protein [Odoribacter sp.]MDP3642883.1 hypothetical protein [Bacteroidota bacterium]